MIYRLHLGFFYKQGQYESNQNHTEPAAGFFRGILTPSASTMNPSCPSAFELHEDISICGSSVSLLAVLSLVVSELLYSSHCDFA